MPQIAEYLFMTLGAVLLVVGVLLLVFKPAAGQNTMKLLGMEVSFSAPGLAVVALGCLMFAAPFLIPPQTSSSTGGQSGSATGQMPSSGSSTTQVPAVTGPAVIKPPPPPPPTKEARIAKLCGLPKGKPLTLLAAKTLTTPKWEYFGDPADSDGQPHSFYGVILERHPASLSLGYGYENGSGPQIQMHNQSRCTAFVPFKPSINNARPVVQIDDWAAGNWAKVEVWELR